MRSSGCACVTSLMGRPSVRSAGYLVDVVLDQLLLRGAIEVARDHDLGRADGQRGDLTTEVGDGLLLGCLDIGSGPFTHGGELGLEPLLLIATERIGLLARLLDDAARLVASIAELRSV